MRSAEYGGDGGFRQTAAATALTFSLTTSANAGVDLHIHADRLMRDDGEGMRLCADALRSAPLHIQNIIARGQGYAVMPIFFRCDPRNFVPPILAQDEQRIFGVIYGRELGPTVFRKLNRLERNDLQVSFQEAWWNG